MDKINYFVNGEEVVHEYHKPDDRHPFELSVREILTRAGFAPPAEYELTRDSNGDVYTDLDKKIPVEFAERFTATHKGATPTS